MFGTISSIGIFSLYKTSESSCLYEYGTNGFYATRQFLTKYIEISDANILCRLGIDMYIASIGPWYSTTNDIIAHESSRYIPTI